MSSEVFIRRPILATVCSLLIILAGAICIPRLPIARYPALAPPSVASPDAPPAGTLARLASDGAAR